MDSIVYLAFEVLVCTHIMALVCVIYVQACRTAPFTEELLTEEDESTNTTDNAAPKPDEKSPPRYSDCV